MTALLSAMVLVWTAALVSLSDISLPVRLTGGLAAVLLSTHLSPLYLAVPLGPPIGALLGLIVLSGLLRSRIRAGLRATLLDSLPKERGDRILWGSIAVLVLVTFYNQFGEMKKLVANVTDFRMFYEAAAALGSGGNPYDVTNGGYFYPPTFAFYLRSITWLPIAGASLLWFTVKLSLLVWTYQAVYRLVGGPGMTGASRRWFIFGMVCVSARFLFADLQYGNTNTFVLWLTVAAVSLDTEERPALAGLALAAAVSIKIVPVLFAVYFAVSRRWRVLIWAGAWILVLNSTPLLLNGGTAWEAWRTYLETGVVGKLSASLDQPDNQSLWGALNRLVDWPLSRTRLVWGVLSVLLTATAAWAVYSLRVLGRRVSTRQAGAASLFFLLGLLVSPGSWVVHYCAVLLPMTFLLREAMKNAASSRLIWGVFVALNLAFTISGWFRLTVRLSIEHSWFVLATLLLFVTVLGLTVRRAATGDPGP